MYNGVILWKLLMCFFILPFRLQDHCLSLPGATRGLGKLEFVTEEIQRESPQKIKKRKE